ncbi:MULTISPECIES: TIR domain-containing protein [Pseudomonadota]|uniref:TIR domain-containing protein n=1 Tax=Pseudomonadota TaxID=1224 RepID=UPI00191A7460|nr:nucleotide-binding protein [Psychrobacter immobilis]
MAVDLFKKIDNTVLDLQASQSQTYEGLLEKLAQLLRHEDLQPFNEALTQNIDLEKFLEASYATQKGMSGTSKLQWTGDDEQDLGLKYALIQKIGNDTSYAFNYAYEFFSSRDNKTISCIHNLVRGLIIPFVRDYKEYVASNSKIEPELKIHDANTVTQSSRKVFVVHGHDDHAKEMMARFLEKNDFEAIVLHEQASGNKTIIEKIEHFADVGFAIILLTPDDMGKSKDGDNYQPRARQNVILELGYFMGKLGRNRVCAFKSGDLEIPTDFSGVIWNQLDNAGAWKQVLSKELSEAGYNLDSNKLLKSLG